MSPFSRRLQQAVTQVNPSQIGYVRPTGYVVVNGTNRPVITAESLLLAGESLLYDAADSNHTPVNLNTLLGRMLNDGTRRVITFPAGRFGYTPQYGNGSGAPWDVSDFRTQGSTYAIIVPNWCAGIWGSGPGQVSTSSTAPYDTTGTVFTMVPMSSTRLGDVPTQASGSPVQMRIIYAGGNLGDVSFGQFHVEGTDQGHIYHAFTIYSPAGKAEVTDVLVSGWKGNNGAPPGETFGLEIHQPKTFTLLRCESDGRRYVGGPDEGAVGCTTANVSSGTTSDCYFHHGIGAQMVLYQCFNTQTYACRFGEVDDTTASSYGNSINHERTSGNAHYNPQMLLNRTGEGIHVSHSNASFTATYNGVAVDAADGTLAIHFNDSAHPDPSLSAAKSGWTPLSSHTDGKLWLQTWHTYDGPNGGCSMSGNAVYSGTTATYPRPRDGSSGPNNLPVIMRNGVDVTDTELHYLHNYNSGGSEWQSFNLSTNIHLRQ